MSVWLDTRGNASLAIAICARCSRKFPIGELMPDPNAPGLMVCSLDRDIYDPYRLPARQTENIALRYARPDTDIANDPFGLISEDGNNFLMDEEAEGYFVP